MYWIAVVCADKEGDRLRVDTVEKFNKDKCDIDFMVDVLMEYAWSADEKRKLPRDVRNAVRRINKYARLFDDSHLAAAMWINQYLQSNGDLK